MARKRKVRKVKGANVLEEAAYILSKAEDGIACVVTRGVLCYFSTKTRDAWVLDFEDSFALCLAVDGERQEFRALECNGRSIVEWPADYIFDGEVFVVMERSGRVRRITGYPTQDIQEAIACAREVHQPPRQ